MYEFTKRAEIAIEHTREFAVNNNYSYIGTEHLLYGLLKEGKGLAAKILQSQKVTVDYIESQISRLEGKMEEKVDNYPELTPRAKRVLENSIKESKRLMYNYVGTEHILLALMKETDSIAVRILIEANVDPQKVFTELIKVIGDDSPITNIEDSAEDDTTPTLNKYSEDLTALAKKERLDKIIGRENELSRLIQILSRKTKNNPLVIGDAGVGKTALVEGLANIMVSKDCPRQIKGKRLLSLNIASMVAGAKYRGDFEERFKKCIEEVEKSENIILFIDEMRTIIGAGSAEGTLDAANILKPYLSRTKIQIIGATTPQEYSKYIEKDAALDRRFQSVIIHEPSVTESIKILMGIKEKYELYHNVKITDKAIKEAVRLSVRYINDKNLPDKAIDIIDEACSSINLEGSSKEDEESIQDIIAKNKAGGKKRKVIDVDKVCEIISKWTQIPVERIREDEISKLKNLEKTLQEKIIGQDEAISALARAIKRNRLGLRDPNRPIASFIFVGPTGVGKTELVKVLAELMFDNRTSIVRLDMSEYMEAHSVSKIIGSPPGYIGFEEGGQLTKRIIRNPYSIVLFDEIEKAHQDVYNILLQILDEGHLTDSTGKKVDFKNTICIMTSNVGAKNITGRKIVGFSSKVNQKEEYIEMKEKVLSELNKTFKPEFLNRLDDIIVFKRLDEESIKKIVKLMLLDFENRAKEQGIRLKFTDNVVEYISKVGFDNLKGARSLKRAIQSNIEDKFADFLLEQSLKVKGKINVDVEGDKILLKENS